MDRFPPVEVIAVLTSREHLFELSLLATGDLAVWDGVDHADADAITKALQDRMNEVDGAAPPSVDQPWEPRNVADHVLLETLKSARHDEDVALDNHANDATVTKLRNLVEDICAEAVRRKRNQCQLAREANNSNAFVPATSFAGQQQLHLVRDLGVR
jgi:hypothetical protein